MSLLPQIPREPPARLRLMSLWFALFAISVDIVELTTGRLASPTARGIGLAAVFVLLVWVVVGYKRQRFPEWSTPFDAVLLAAITAGASLPLRSMGLYLAMMMMRVLYVSRREVWLLPVSYGIARVIGMSLTADPKPYAALSLTVMFQFIGLAFITAILFMLMQAMEGQARAEEQLREAQKMRAVGQLAGGIAHDFNNLLTVIGGHVYMVERTDPLSAEATKHLNGITQTIDRAGSLTRQLLAFGRRQLLHPTVVDLNAVVRGAARLIEPAVGERIRVVTELDSAQPHIRADVGQLEQVLLNIGLNARDAMPQGGTLRIATGSTEGPDGVQATVTFEDSGVGMNAETLAHVFEPFFTTKRGGRGTGLGLATAYGIVKQSGGDIRAISTVGKGSTFTITLPVVASPPPAVPKLEGIPVLPAMLRVKRVLVVEDGDGVREFVRSVLVNAGVNVSTAADGAEGLAVAREQGYAFDLVVTDVVMPGLTGPQMVERLRETRPTLPVLYMTGYADNAVTRDGLHAGLDGLIEKPFSARVLLEAIQAISAGEGRALATAPGPLSREGPKMDTILATMRSE